jgi:hypothetical protein
MKTAIRLFALFVALTGLAAASLAPAKTQIHDTHKSVIAGRPGALLSLPAPLPCQSVGACYAPTPSSH